MKSPLLLYITCLLTCLYTGCIHSQTTSLKAEKELSFYLLDVESGLSNNGVNSIAQDSLGFIWLATPEGLNRYDGTHFKVYRRNDSILSASVINNEIESVKLINNNRLLIYTGGGINIYDPKEEVFALIGQDGEIQNEDLNLEFNEDLALKFFTQGVRTTGRSSFLYNHNANNIRTISSNEILSIEQEGDSVIWVGTLNHGLSKINRKAKMAVRIPYTKNSKTPSSRINALYRDKSGNLWIGSRQGLQVITKHGDTLKLDKSVQEGKGLSGSSVLCFEEDDDGKMWVGTRNGGLNIFNTQAFLQQEKDLYVKWYLPKDDGSSVFNRTVLSLEKDWDGNMWIGTSTGLNFVNPKGEPIKLLRKNISRKQTIAHDRIGALAESADGNIWIGTDGDGLNLYNPLTESIKHYKHNPNNKNSISNDYIISLLEDSKGRVWVGTYQGGINLMDKHTGRCKHYLQGSVEQGSDVRVIFEDSKKRIWVGTNRGGLYKFDEKEKKFIYITVLGKNDVRGISEDKHGILWMATYGDGILQFNPENNKSVFYNVYNTSGFKWPIFYSILALPDGHVMAGTRHGGLVILNPVTKDIQNLTVNDGLSNNNVSSIVMGAEGKEVWLGTYKGISRYYIETKKLDNLNAYNNIQQSKFNIGSGIRSKRGTIYLGGDKGLNIFDPENLRLEREKTPIVFENLEVISEKIFANNSKRDGILDSSILYVNHIILNYEQTFLSIDYVALKYPFVKNIKYAYQIKGYHNHWINTDNAGKVNLTKIPQGDYTLLVKAELGTGKEVTKQLLLTIKPPFWKTPIAYLCYILLIMVSVWVALTYYSKHIKLINSLLFEKKQRQLEHDFNEERIRFFTSFSHELKTPLTLIIAPIEDLISEVTEKKFKHRLSLIHKNAKTLFQSINQLLEFRKSNLGLSKLNLDKHNLSDYLEKWVHNYIPLAKKRKVLLTYSGPVEDFSSWFDLEKLHIVVNNLLSNAFKYSHEKGKIHVSLTYDDSNFIIKVKDDGLGISKKAQEYIFDRYYQSNSNKNGVGIGLSLSKNYTELHEGAITINSKLNKGSEFIVSIPRDKAVLTQGVHDKANGNTVENKKTIVDNTDLIPWTPQEVSTLNKRVSSIKTKEHREVVLLIDDNQDILEYLEGLLEDKYDLIYASDGEEGVRKAQEYIPDLIVSDIMMPKMSGIELCSLLKQQIETTHIPIILLTAKGNTDSVKVGYEEGADDYIVKPFNSEILQSRIKNLLNNRKKLQKYFLKEETRLPDSFKEKPKLLDKEKHFLNKLEEIVIAHLGKEKMDVNSISQDMGMSRTSLFRKVKAITGLNINQFINRSKMNKAYTLIKEGELTISQVSFEVGFNDVKYFRKLFKEQFGQVPSGINKN